MPLVAALSKRSNNLYLLSVSEDNPRYFINQAGEPVFLAGSKYWLALQDGGESSPPSAFDWDTYLSTMVGKGHNCIPFYIWEGNAGWYSEDRSADWYISPYPWVNNGDGDDPNFDLTTYDSDYFDRLRTRIIEARNNGMYVTINIFHGFMVRSGTFNTITNAWAKNPFKSGNNSNSINGDPTATGDGYDVNTLNVAAITAIQDDLIEHYVDVLGDLDNILWEVCLESDGTYTRGGHDCDEWQDHMIAKIHAYEDSELGYRHPVIYSVQWPGGDNDEIIASAADGYSPNAEQDAAGTKPMLVDTDHISWTSFDAQWVWRALARGAGGFWIMDGGYSTADDQGGGVAYNDAEPIRNNMGYAAALAALVDLLHTQPDTGLCSTTYALIPASSSYHEFLCFQPSDDSFTLDLSAESGTFDIRKVNCADGSVDNEQTTTGGDTRTITQPTGWTSGWACWVRPQ